MQNKEYTLGDMTLRYILDEKGHVGFLMYPVDCPLGEEKVKNRKPYLDPLVQVKLTGDIYQGCYAPGNTLRCGQSTMELFFDSQEVLIVEKNKKIIKTVLRDSRGYEAIHRVFWKENDPFIRINCTYKNNSTQPVMMEMLSSFSMTGISPYLEGDGSGEIMVHRLQSRWSQEGKLLSQSMEDLQLETSWNVDSVRCERFGQVGSMPVNKYFPFLAIEDIKTGVFWGAQLAHSASWQMEIYRMDDEISISGGIADREFGHWMKELPPGAEFTSPTAILTTIKTDFLDEMCQRLVEAGEEAADSGPDCEQHLPVLFNEYCTTWGCPSHENICRILKSIENKGFEYFVIDCGWFKADGVPWDISMGDYLPSQTLFPKGLAKTTEAIRNAGMKPGIWFEIESVGSASDAYTKYTDHMLRRDGQVLTTTRRRFWDMRDPWTLDYLSRRVIGTLKEYGFSYMKIDYNDTIGIGCDGAESQGEGLRQNMEETKKFLEKVKKEIPGIILENCASGGHRLEPGFMAATSMASFSDAHECVEIPIIAGNLHRVILPRQSQIWAVIREKDSLKRIAYSISATFLGRMCLSGDVTNLTVKQWEVIERGIEFYKKIAPVIKYGQTYHLSPEIKRIRHPVGWQGILRLGRNGQAYCVIHIFDGFIGKEIPSEIRMKLPEYSKLRIADIYSDKEETVLLENKTLIYRPQEIWKSVAVYLIDTDF